MGSPGEVPDGAWEVREGFLEEGILELCRRDAWGQPGKGGRGKSVQSSGIGCAEASSPGKA